MAYFGRVGGMLRQSLIRKLSQEWTSVIPAAPALYLVSRGMASSKLFVGGLSWGTDEETLREAFSSYGNITEVKIIADRDTGRSRGFGFVSFTSDAEAESALQAMDGQSLTGRVIRVNYANYPGTGPRGSGSGMSRGVGLGAGRGNFGSNGGGFGRSSVPSNDNDSFGRSSGGIGNEGGGFDRSSGGFGNDRGGFGNSGGFRNEVGSFGGKGGLSNGEQGSFGSESFGSKGPSFGYGESSFSRKAGGFGREERGLGQRPGGFGDEEGVIDGNSGGSGTHGNDFASNRGKGFGGSPGADLGMNSATNRSVGGHKNDQSLNLDFRLNKNGCFEKNSGIGRDRIKNDQSLNLDFGLDKYGTLDFGLDKYEFDRNSWKGLDRTGINNEEGFVRSSGSLENGGTTPITDSRTSLENDSSGSAGWKDSTSGNNGFDSSSDWTGTNTQNSTSGFANGTGSFNGSSDDWTGPSSDASHDESKLLERENDSGSEDWRNVDSNKNSNSGWRGS
ncbi:hypothetical protein O6H91_15G062700 [Diphasiastrum complanatum]|uniref:Uncharacterized protein n=1 Tax=Diphasiastrum complanatum TaxID=34168 RepID=A0ACC2BIW6_DIPCM|nr:hypothetical protein O6H91_15G062700 [Diphasiastrum complanatum]